MDIVGPIITLATKAVHCLCCSVVPRSTSVSYFNGDIATPPLSVLPALIVVGSELHVMSDNATITTALPAA
jgi:hypothetical protein